MSLYPNILNVFDILLRNISNSIE